MDKLIFLKKLRKDVEIIDLSRVGNIAIPQYWRDVFNEKDSQAKKDKLIAHWKRVVGSELPNSISFIKSDLVELDLIVYNNRCSILYGIKCEDGEIYYFEGENPLECISHSLLNGMPA